MGLAETAVLIVMAQAFQRHKMALRGVQVPSQHITHSLNTPFHFPKMARLNAAGYLVPMYRVWVGSLMYLHKRSKWKKI